MKHIAAAAAALSLCSTAYADIVRTCLNSDVCYSLSVPGATADSGSGDIYFQLSGPTSNQYVALGQGSSMSGANMFVMYTAADGNNVTVSPRLGKGHATPEHDTSANIQLLSGSGVSNGIMTANVPCSNCDSWNGGSMDFSTTSASWIYAVKAGSSIDSDDLDENIDQHDSASSFTFDLSRARGGSVDVNPFQTSSNASAESDPSSGVGSATDSSTTSSPYSASAIARWNRMVLAHAILACLAFVAIFPIGGILIRIANFSGLIWIHAALQIFGVVVYIAAFGIGAYLATQGGLLSSAHPVIGIALLVLVVTQSPLGWLHHKLFKKYGHRTLWSYLHLWQGRAAVLLGMVNGGLGLALAGAERRNVIAYSVVAGIVGVVYIAAVVIGEVRRRKRVPPGYDEKSQWRHGRRDVGSRDENMRDYSGSRSPGRSRERGY